jgi:hypothetical protein
VALQGDDTCLGVAEDAAHDSAGPKAGEAVCIRKAHDFSHSEIMPEFHAPENEKNHGKTAARAAILARIYPHALEKSHRDYLPYDWPLLLF